MTQTTSIPEGASPPSGNEPPPPVFPPTPVQEGVGLPVARFTVDQAIGQLSRQIENWTNAIVALNAWLSTKTVEDLQAAPFNYTADDALTLRSAGIQLDKLAQIYRGQAALPAAEDLGVFARRCAGLVLPGMTL